MEMRNLCDGLERELATKKTARVFDEAKERHPVLEPFSSVDELRAFLTRRGLSEEEQGQRDAAVKALVTEAQSRRHSCWSALLILVHFRSLWSTCRFHGQYIRAGMTFDDLNLLVVEAFLDAVAEVDLSELNGRPISKALVRETRRVVGVQVRGTRSQADHEVYAEDHEIERAVARASREERQPTPEHEPLVDRAALIDQVQHFLTDDELQLLTATFGEDRRLIVWAREQAANDEPEQFDRTYANLRKRRGRLVKLLRRQVTQLEAVVAQLEEEGQRCAA